MTEWETYTPRPDKPDYSVVINGQNVPLYRDEDGFLRHRDRYLTAYEADVLIALGKTVRPRPKDVDDEVKRLRAANRALQEQLARSTAQSALIRYDQDDYIRRASVALEDAEKKVSRTWRFIALVVIFAWSAITFGQMAGWLP